LTLLHTLLLFYNLLFRLTSNFFNFTDASDNEEEEEEEEEEENPTIKPLPKTKEEKQKDMDRSREHVVELFGGTFAPNAQRGCSSFYGYKALKTFLRKNNLITIIRAHEVQMNGYYSHFDPNMMKMTVDTLKEEHLYDVSKNSIHEEIQHVRRGSIEPLRTEMFPPAMTGKYLSEGASIANGAL